ncbi:SymE family type I addiction module toxin [Dickeya dianthicola]|nr:SymE family type I addiction module toxin [Dickeya dianthicola]MCI4239314.1 type I toxin-antitoxin system SymE family toxin [Dickeya dianthicola]MCI4256427.1 type I toxin-antitoxin system SymE family toxin [Dickeya dianthicola]
MRFIIRHQVSRQPGFVTVRLPPALHRRLRPNGMKGNPPPQLTLKGRWLEDLGFNTGQPVIVTVERGRLVIEAELRI